MVLQVGLWLLVVSLESFLWTDEQQPPSMVLKVVLALSLGSRGNFLE